MKNSQSSLVTFREQAEKPFEQQERLSRLQAELTEVEQRLQGTEEPAPPTPDLVAV